MQEVMSKFDTVPHRSPKRQWRSRQQSFAFEAAVDAQHNRTVLTEKHRNELGTSEVGLPKRALSVRAAGRNVN